MFLKLSQRRIIWYLLVDVEGRILCSVHSIRFVKYVFSAKIYFVKTSTRIVKHESRVVKSNPVRVLRLIISGINLLELKKIMSIRCSRDSDSLPMGRRFVVLLVGGVGKCCG